MTTHPAIAHFRGTYAAILSGEYTEGDQYWERHDTVEQAADRLMELVTANDDNELNIGTFKITLEKE